MIMQPQDLGPAYTARTICDRLHVGPDTLRHLVDSDQILRVTTVDELDIYPAFQIGDDGSLLPGLPDVIAELATGVDDPWTWWRWMVAVSDKVGRRTAWEMLKAGDVEDTVMEACRTAWAWRP